MLAKSVLVLLKVCAPGRVPPFAPPLATPLFHPQKQSISYGYVEFNQSCNFICLLLVYRVRVFCKST